MKADDLKIVMAEHDLYDDALLSHGFTGYMRDYQLVVESFAEYRCRVYLYLFKYCVEAQVRSNLSDETYRASLDDRALDTKQWNAGGLSGFLWGVRYATLEPGWCLVEGSERAASWQERIGIDFHEVLIASNVFRITLVFSDLDVYTCPAHLQRPSSPVSDM